jgi:hypothetical protein
MAAGAGFFLLCCGFALLCWLSRSGREQAGLGLILTLRSALPPILLGWCLVLGAGSPLVGSLRLELRALEAQVIPGVTLFRVGSGAFAPEAEPDVVVPPGRGAMAGEPGGDLVTVSGARQGRGVDVTLISRAVPGGAILTGFSRDGAETLVGTSKVDPGDKICWKQTCRTLTELSPAVRTGLAGELAPWPAGSAIYPVAVLFGGASGASSFLFQTFSADYGPTRMTGTWHLAMLDPSVRIEPGQTNAREKGDACQPIAGGCQIENLTTTAQIRIMRVNFGSGEANCRSKQPPNPSLIWMQAKNFSHSLNLSRAWLQGENQNPACRLIDRRRLTLSYRPGDADTAQDDTAQLAFAGREIVAMGTPEDVRGRLSAPDRLEEEDAFALSSVLGAHRPGSILSAAIGDFPFALRTFLSDPEPREGTLCRDLAANDLCAGTQRQAIRFTLDQMSIPWMLVIIAMAGAAVVHLVAAETWKREPHEGLIVALVQFLLALRAVIAAEGAMIDPDIPWRELFGEAAMAMAALPSVLIALRNRDTADPFAFAALAVFNLLLFAGLWQWLGQPGIIALTLLGLALGALGLALAKQVSPSRRVADRIGAAGPKLLAFLGRHAAGLIIILVAVRLALPLVGFKERIGGVAISTIYLPGLIIAFASLIAAAARDPERRLARGIVFVVIAGAAAAAPYLARDTGFGLVHLWPILGIAAWQALAWRKEGARRGLWPWLATGPALAVLSYSALVAVVLSNPPPPDGASLKERLDYSNQLGGYEGQNRIRFIATVRPDWVSSIGNRNASQQMAQTIHLVERTRHIFGNAYMEPSNFPISQQPNLSALRDVHLTDNVAAVHLMAPFGRIAAFGLLLVLLSVCAALCSGRGADFWRRRRALAGALAMWTVFGAGTYMILANLLLVPFTGRNIYLLAPSSGADLIEGLVLFAIGVVGLRRVQA